MPSKEVNAELSKSKGSTVKNNDDEGLLIKDWIKTELEGARINGRMLNEYSETQTKETAIKISNELKERNDMLFAA